MSVAISSSKDNERAFARLRKFISDPNGDEKDCRFQNGKLSSFYAKAAQKAKEAEERKRIEDMVKVKKKELHEARDKKRKNSLKNFPTDERDCLPGLFRK